MSALTSTSIAMQTLASTNSFVAYSRITIIVTVARGAVAASAVSASVVEAVIGVVVLVVV